MTFTASLLPIVDELLALISVPSGITKDGSGSAPVVHAPDTLYGWPVRQTPRAEGDGSLDDSRFTLRLAWAVSGKLEEDGQVRLRAVSDLIDAGVQAVLDAVRVHRQGGTWEWLQVDAVTYDAIVTFDVRAAWIDLSGYRLIG